MHSLEQNKIMDHLNDLLKERPCFHQPETEVQSLSGSRASLVPGLDERPADRVCYGLGTEVLSYIAESVRAGSKTLETGAGSSTLVFALCGAEGLMLFFIITLQLTLFLPFRFHFEFQQP